MYNYRKTQPIYKNNAENNVLHCYIVNNVYILTPYNFTFKIFLFYVQYC